MTRKRSKAELAAIHTQNPLVNKIDTDGKPKDFHMYVVDMKTHKKVPGSDTIVRSKHYGQAVDSFILGWNKNKRMGMTIGYPAVQGKIN